MDPQEFEGAGQREAGADRETERFCQKYNINLEIAQNTWSAQTMFPVREAGEVLNRFGGMNRESGTDIHNTYAAIAGSFIRRVYPQIPQTTIRIGEQPTPPEIRRLTFLGETRNPKQELDHKINHELSHVAIFYEMVDALEELHPGANLDDAIKYYGELTKSFREAGRPLSMLDKIPANGGNSFYNEDEMVYEDLAEALAIKYEGGNMWERYKEYLKGSGIGDEYSSDFENLINKIYEITKQN